jgi:hypothetical protein
MVVVETPRSGAAPSTSKISLTILAMRCHRLLLDPQHHRVVACSALILRTLRLIMPPNAPRPTPVHTMSLQHGLLCPQFFLLAGKGGIFFAVWFAIDRSTGTIPMARWAHRQPACVLAPFGPVGGRRLCLTQPQRVVAGAMIETGRSVCGRAKSPVERGGWHACSPRGRV